jgi:hypothetical protein
VPTISMFYGVLILMYFYDNKKHSRPHIHAEYAEYEASISIDDGTVISGNLPPSKLKLVQAWIEIHREDLLGVCRTYLQLGLIFGKMAASLSILPA